MYVVWLAGSDGGHCFFLCSARNGECHGVSFWLPLVALECLVVSLGRCTDIKTNSICFYLSSRLTLRSLFLFCVVSLCFTQQCAALWAGGGSGLCRFLQSPELTTLGNQSLRTGIVQSLDWWAHTLVFVYICTHAFACVCVVYIYVCLCLSVYVCMCVCVCTYV